MMYREQSLLPPRLVVSQQQIHHNESYSFNYCVSQPISGIFTEVGWISRVR